MLPAACAPELCIQDGQQAHLPYGSLQYSGLQLVTGGSMCLSTTWVPRKPRLGFSGWEGSDIQVSDFQLFVFRLTFLTYPQQCIILPFVGKRHLSVVTLIMLPNSTTQHVRC